MTKRSYGHYCALAQALDIIGERWTILLVRELLVGPRRFKDLLEGLPNISTNLLSERLKQLEQSGVLFKHRLPPPADVDVYELTPLGYSLEEILIVLARWGAQVLPSLPEGKLDSSLGSEALKLKTLFNPKFAKGIHEVYELHIDDHIINVATENGNLDIQQGPAKKPDLILHTEGKNYAFLLMGQLEAKEAIAKGNIYIEGNEEALYHFIELFKMRRPHQDAPQ